MVYRLASILVLGAILIQGAFGSLQGAAVICLGGGHEHEPAEIVQECEFACSHNTEWPTPAENTDHRDDCECVDIELGPFYLLLTPRINDQETVDLASASPMVWLMPITKICTLEYERPPIQLNDPGGAYRLSLIRSTRLIV